MMFNYSVASDAEQIRSAMARETVPSQCCPVNAIANEKDQAKTKLLPLHPNIVIMPGYFVDQTPYLSGGADAYPAALPSRLHEGGFGRNSTMFLVMKKYSMTLREFLEENDISMATRCVLFTQLLEGVQHLHQHAISHRDMKSDNILVDVSNGKDQPWLAICDFGCCLMESEHGFQIPYTTGEVSKGGNSALMAPEIKCANPGKHSVLDYSKADLWAAGALAYEIFGLENPFYGKEHKLDSRTYQEKDLPKLPDEVPLLVKDLVYSMLKRDSSKRPTPTLAATIMQLHLWGAVYLESIRSLPKQSIKHLKWWLEQFVVQTMCQLVFPNSVASVELWLKHTFLCRITLQDLLLVCEDQQ
ncbi:serine/threonine-protein kinase PINK1, mitochondrial-like [Pomacea canaliculata]|uniref:serine/threonine-protein kinase PINK1, mitochondrial-like n=1 Tax=Pomacea canaliculata TaxID=400727 RepID=UPI000D736202|nr:serine/threonine-protein kinase PINK1, mitochondrial-like [Pomacea canaliculata]